MSKKYFKTIVKVEVLSEGAPWRGGLASLAGDISDGEFSGRQLESDVTELDEQEVVVALLAQGSAPSFLIGEEGGSDSDEAAAAAVSTTTDDPSPRNGQREPLLGQFDFSADDVAKCRRFGCVTRSGVVYHEELAGPGGMSYVLLREPTTTQAMLDAAVAQLRCDRDVVGKVKVTPVIETDVLRLLIPLVRLLDQGTSTVDAVPQQKDSAATDLADSELAQYNFGDSVTVVGQGTWDCTDANDLSKIVYIRGDDTLQDADSERVSFHVRFNPNGSVDDVYGLLVSNGAEIGSRGPSEQDSAEHGLPLSADTPPMPPVKRPRMRG